jgi:hypothetical protein
MPTVLEVLVGQRVDRNVVNIDFRATHKEQQKVERTLENGKTDKPVVLRHRLAI